MMGKCTFWSTTSAHIVAFWSSRRSAYIAAFFGVEVHIYSRF